MARIRTIKPEFFRHEELFEAEKESGLPLRVAFAGLWTVADREGRFKWKPKQIKFDVLPWDDIDFTDVLESLCKYGFVIKYVVDETEYGLIPSFSDHQVINNKESKSKLPPPPKSDIGKDASFTRADACQGEGKGKEGKGRESEGDRVTTHGKGKVFVMIKPVYVHDTYQKIFELDKYFESKGQLEVLKQSGMTAFKEFIQTNPGRDFNDPDHLYSSFKKFCLEGAVVKLIPDPKNKASPFDEAEYNKSLWTDEAWRSKYAIQIRDNPEFRKHFNL